MNTTPRSCWSGAARPFHPFGRGLFMLLSALLLALPVPTLAAPGDLDPSFDGDGRVLTDFPSGGLSGFEIVSALAVQPDGTLVAAGTGFTGTADVSSDFVVLRYNRDGTPDQGFGDDGRVRTSFNGPADAFAVLVQPDGKVVAAGRRAGLTNYGFALARYNRDGSLDASFGIAGRVLTDIGAGAFPTALVLQPDGKLVAAGYRNLVSVFLSSGLALARYNPDGSLDSSFGSGGLVVTDVGQPVPGESFTGANALVLQPDGRLVAAGQAGRIFDDDFFLARYNPDGSLDTSFGAGGLMVTDFGQPSRARALVLQPDGKLVAAGAVGVEAPGGGIVSSSLARFNPDGSPDTSFGDSGLVITNFGDNTGADELVLQSDGKLVTLAAGFVVARYDAHGSLDTSFGNGGLVRTDFGISFVLSNALVLQPDGKLVAGGTVNVSGGSDSDFDFGDLDFALARYLTTDEPLAVPPSCDGLPATILGTTRNDAIRGTRGPDVILGLGGNDTIRGLGGNDTICGGPGNDQLIGNDENDRLFGESGNDKLFGDKGNDMIYGGPGRDRLIGNDGNDRLFGQGQNDKLFGDSGRDRLDGGSGRDACRKGEKERNCEGKAKPSNRPKPPPTPPRPLCPPAGNFPCS